MKAAKFTTRIDERNRITIPKNNVKAICKEFDLTQEQFQNSEIGFEIKYIIPQHQTLRPLDN